MKFINPSFLWALLVLAIPIIIHLFHFRRYKTVYFSNVKFLKEVKQERNNIRQLKRWLLLMSRLLVLFFLVAAFAQPFLKGKNADASITNAISIYVDNSYSMGLKNKGVELLEIGKDQAADIIQSYSDRDRFLVLTNDMSIDEQRWKSKEDALTYLNEVELTYKTQSLDKILGKQSYLFTRSDANRLKNFIISDFQKSIIQGAEIKKDSAMQHILVQLNADNVKNVYIDSVWMIDPVSTIGSSNSVLYKIKNSSEIDANNVRISLKINDQVQAIREMNLIAEEERIDTLYFNILNEGWQLAEIDIADYPINFDDQFYFSFNVEKTKKVLEIYQGSTPNVVKRIFANDQLILLTNSQSNQLDYSKFGDYDLIILNELESVSSGLSSAIEKYIEGGGNALLIPTATTTTNTYAGIFNAIANVNFGDAKIGNYKVDRPNLSDKLLMGIVEQLPSNTAMPIVKKYFPILASGRVREQSILKLNNNETLLSVFPKEEGNLIIQAVPNQSDFSELQSHWLYAPLIYNISLLHGLDQPLYQIGGRDQWVAIDYKAERKDNVVTLSGADFEFIPEQRILNNKLFINTDKNDQVQAGHYKITDNNEILAWLSFNVDRIESEMKFADKESLREQFPNVTDIASGTKGDLKAAIQLRDQGRPLWKICLLLALLFILAEVAIIKLIPN
ncbi:MAG: BatA domain-containing protein [Chitinophagales bacterium]